jgi:hypothetical protein
VKNFWIKSQFSITTKRVNISRQIIYYCYYFYSNAYFTACDIWFWLKRTLRKNLSIKWKRKTVKKAPSTLERRDMERKRKIRFGFDDGFLFSRQRMEIYCILNWKIVITQSLNEWAFRLRYFLHTFYLLPTPTAYEEYYVCAAHHNVTKYVEEKRIFIPFWFTTISRFLDFTPTHGWEIYLNREKKLYYTLKNLGVVRIIIVITT